MIQALIAGAGIVSSLMGAKSQAKAAQAAADAQLTGVRESNALQEKIFNQQRADTMPFRNNALAAGNSLYDALGIDTPDYTQNYLSQPQQTAQPKTPLTIDQFRQILNTLGPRENPAGYGADGVSSTDPFSQRMPLGGGISQDDLLKLYDSLYSQTGSTGSTQSAEPSMRQRSDSFGWLNKQFTGQDLQNEPGYQFGLREGTNTLQNSAAARGGLLSGNALRGINQYGQDYAGTKYGEAFNRDAANKDRFYNYLSGQYGQGQGANSQLNQAGSNYATNAGNNLMTGAAASGNAALASGNARASGLLGVGNAITNAYNNYNMNNLQQPSYDMYNQQGYQ